jgi:hypothetical protein
LFCEKLEYILTDNVPTFTNDEFCHICKIMANNQLHFPDFLRNSIPKVKRNYVTYETDLMPGILNAYLIYMSHMNSSDKVQEVVEIFRLFEREVIEIGAGAFHPTTAINFLAIYATITSTTGIVFTP